jgi:hypothetical protein
MPAARRPFDMLPLRGLRRAGLSAGEPRSESNRQGKLFGSAGRVAGPPGFQPKTGKKTRGLPVDVAGLPSHVVATPGDISGTPADVPETPAHVGDSPMDVAGVCAHIIVSCSGVDAGCIIKITCGSACP